jgi:hypothetical protein
MSVIDRAKKYVESQEKRVPYEDRDDRKPQKTKNALRNEFEHIKRELVEDKKGSVDELAKEFNKQVGGRFTRNTRCMRYCRDMTGT